MATIAKAVVIPLFKPSDGAINRNKNTAPHPIIIHKMCLFILLISVMGFNFSCKGTSLN